MIYKYININKLCVRIFLIILFTTSYGELMAQDTFNILVRRLNVKNNLETGQLFLNGLYIGKTYENSKLKIQKGVYPGYMRYFSGKNFVAGPFGTIGKEGDFLLEIGNVTWSDGKKRTHLLFHGGNKPEHSTGCILLGGIPKKNGVPYLPKSHPLSILRVKFYGSDNPISTPNKPIVVTIIEGYNSEGTYRIRSGTCQKKVKLSKDKSGNLILRGLSNSNKVVYTEKYKKTNDHNRFRSIGSGNSYVKIDSDDSFSFHSPTRSCSFSRQ